MSALPADAPSAGTALRWTVHPAAESPGRAAVVLAIVVTAALLTGQVAGSPLAGLAAALLLLLSLRAFFLPRTYELLPWGARESGPLCATRSLAWEALRRVSSGPHGVHLSPRHHPSRWLPDRGLFLRTTDNHQEVLGWLQRVEAP